MIEDTPLPHKWDNRDVCVYCRLTRQEAEEQKIACRKPRFGEGAPGGFGGITFANPKLRDDDGPGKE